MQEDTYRGEIGNSQSLNLYAYVTNNPVKYVDTNGNMPVVLLNALSTLYNRGTLDSKQTSAATLILNGLGVWTGFHEIAQLNISKHLFAMGLDSTLEYKIKTSSGKCIEADIVSGINVWEVKPVGSDGLAQLKRYVVEGGLIAGPMLSPIEDIPVVEDIKMGIIFPEAGLANYYFYRYDEQGELVFVPSTVAEKAYKKKVAQAAIVAGVIVGGSLALDALTAGASTADNIPSLILALNLASDILMQH